jgi:ABC-type multidrug transport system fused ATPase/permease subunit
MHQNSTQENLSNRTIHDDQQPAVASTTSSSEISPPLKNNHFSGRLRQFASDTFLKEFILGPEVEANNEPTKDKDLSLASTIWGAANVLWTHVPSVLGCKGLFAITSAAIPLTWSWMNGNMVGSISSLLPTPPTAIPLPLEEPVAWGIGVALMSLGSFALVGDLSARAQNLYNAWEARRLPLLTKGLLHQVTGSWSFEGLDNSKDQLAYERFKDHGSKLYALAQNTIEATTSSLASLVAAGFLWKLDWRLSCVAVAFMSARVFRDLKESKTGFEIEKRSAEARRRLDVKNNLSASPKLSRDMRLLGKSSSLQDEYQQGMTEIHQKELKNERRVQLVRLVYDLIPAGIVVTSAALVAKHVGAGVMNIPTAAAMLGYAWNLVFQCRGVGFQIGQVLQAKTFAAESLEFLNSRVEPEKDRIKIPQKKVPPMIELKNVTVNRGDKCILDVPYLKIEPGQIIGIVGREGAGKSTLLKTILGMRKIDSGEVILSWDGDRYDITQCDLPSLHKMVGCNNQDFAIPEGMTVREVLELGMHRGTSTPEVSMEDAVTLTHAMEFIEQNADGFDTIIGAGWGGRDAQGKETHSVDFSPGQRKLIGLATTLRSKAPILVLDEPSSGVSPQTAKAVLQEICKRAKAEGTTVFIVSHHFENFSFADHILSVDGGKIVQNDSPDRLAHQEGLYRDGALQSVQQSLELIGLQLRRTTAGTWYLEKKDYESSASNEKHDV